MSHRRPSLAPIALALLLQGARALAQTDAAAPTDAAATDAPDAPAQRPADGDRCVPDTVLPDHAPEIRLATSVRASPRPAGRPPT